MFGQTYYHRIFHNLTVAFGTLFNEIVVVRIDPNTGEEVSRLPKVPILYEAKQKYYVRNSVDPKLDAQFALPYPRMAFQFTDLVRDPQSQLTTTATMPDLNP